MIDQRRTLNPASHSCQFDSLAFWPCGTGTAFNSSNAKLKVTAGVFPLNSVELHLIVFELKELQQMPELGADHSIGNGACKGGDVIVTDRNDQ